MVKVIRVQSFGGPDVLGIDELAQDDPGPHEVRIRTGAIGLNRIEAVYRAGGFGPVPLPARIGYEAAGTIEAIGAEVKSLRVGDRVSTIPGLAMEKYGVYAESFVYPANMLVAISDTQSFDDAAATWMAFLTAYALAEDKPIAQGDSVIVTAASSSVGLAAIQIILAEGGIPIAVTRTRAKVEALKQFGAAHVIVGDEEKPAERVLEITNGEGAPFAFDAVGGAAITGLTRAMGQGGKIIVYGALAGDELRAPLHILMLKGLSIRGFSANQVTLDPSRLARALNYIATGLKEGRFAPVIDKRFSFEDMAAGHAYLERSEQIGKIVVSITL